MVLNLAMTKWNLVGFLVLKLKLSAQLLVGAPKILLSVPYAELQMTSYVRFERFVRTSNYGAHYQKVPSEVIFGRTN